MSKNERILQTNREYESKHHRTEGMIAMANLNINQEQPLVSVLLPAYCVEAYLERCVKSITAQTYCNLEIIIVDDASPDKSGDIAEQLASQDQRITVIHHKTNQGLSGARNSGLDHATGDFITFVDSDDWVEPDYVNYLMDIMRKTDADIVMCPNFFTSRYRKQNEDDSISVISPEDMLCDIMYNRIHVGVWNRLYKRSVIGNKRFRMDALTGEGMQFNTQVIPCAHSIGVGHRRIYTYNVDNNTSATKQPNIERQAYGSVATLDIIKDTLQPRDRRLDDAVEYQYFTTSLYALIHLVRAHALKQNRTFVQKLIRNVRHIAPRTFTMEISMKQRAKSLLAWVSPLLTVRFAIFWRYVLGRKQRV